MLCLWSQLKQIIDTFLSPGLMCKCDTTYINCYCNAIWHFVQFLGFFLQMAGERLGQKTLSQSLPTDELYGKSADSTQNEILWTKKNKHCTISCSMAHYVLGHRKNLVSPFQHMTFAGSLQKNISAIQFVAFWKKNSSWFFSGGNWYLLTFNSPLAEFSNNSGLNSELNERLTKVLLRKY